MQKQDLKKIIFEKFFGDIKINKKPVKSLPGVYFVLLFQTIFFGYICYAFYEFLLQKGFGFPHGEYVIISLLQLLISPGLMILFMLYITIRPFVQTFIYNGFINFAKKKQTLIKNLESIKSNISIDKLDKRVDVVLAVEITSLIKQLSSVYAELVKYIRLSKFQNKIFFNVPYEFIDFITKEEKSLGEIAKDSLNTIKDFLKNHGEELQIHTQEIDKQIFETESHLKNPLLLAGYRIKKQEEQVKVLV